MTNLDATMSDRETNLLRSLTQTTWKFYLWVGILVTVTLWGLYAYVTQLRQGLIVTGLRDQISWGIYIINFVFFISISIAGTLISAVLRLTQSGWRRPITRMAEAITLVALMVAAPLIVIDLGRPDRILNMFLYGRIQSTLLWDFLAVSTYLVGCLIYFYLPLVPDLATLAARPELSAWHRRLYRVLSSGWRGSPNQVHLLEKSISIMAVVLLPLAVATHSVLAWIFSMSLRPGWDSSLFGPYFVVGAIYAGCACVILSMYVLRRVLHLEDYLESSHFRNLGLLLLTFASLYTYFNLSEYLTMGYKLESTEKVLFQSLLWGEDAPLFWSVHILLVIVPIFLLGTVLLWKRYKQFVIPGVAFASAMVVIGAWGKRYLIVVPTLQNPFLPAQGVPWEWTHYRPTWIEWAITAGAFAGFLLIYTFLTKLFPMVSIWETRGKEVATMEERIEQAVPLVRPQPYMPPPLRVLLIAAMGLAAVSASAQQAPGNPKGELKKPSAMTLEWEAVTPAEPTATSPETAADPQAKGSNRVYFFAYQLLSPLFSGGGGTLNEAEEKPMRQVAITAKLRDNNGDPLAYRPVGFALETSFGTLLQFSKIATDGEGRAKLVVRDHRCGTYPFQATYGGDQAFQQSYALAKVDFGPCPAPALPASGVLITPYATGPITLASVLFFGSMWCVFFYVGYLYFWRTRRAGEAEGPMEIAADGGGSSRGEL